MMDSRVDVVMGHSCNLNCRFCMGEDRMRGKDFSFNVLKSSLLGLRRQGYPSVVFNGGEPTMRKPLRRLVRLSSYLGFSSIGVQTNGLMLSDMDFLRGLVSDGIGWIGITVPTVHRALYDRIVSRDGAHSLLMEALRNIMTLREEKIGFGLEFDIVLTPEALGRLPDDIMVLSAYSSIINIKFPGCRGNALVSGSIPKIEDAASAVRKALAAFPDNGGQVQYMPHCMLRGHESSLMDISMQDIMVSEGGRLSDFRDAFSHTHVKLEACIGCSRHASCPGVDRGYVGIHGMPDIRRYGQDG
jgi:hypothetical protein